MSCHDCANKDECFPIEELEGPVKTVGDLLRALRHLPEDALDMDIIMLDIVPQHGDVYSGRNIAAVRQIADAICLVPAGYNLN